FSGLTIHPMWPNPVEPIRFLQPFRQLLQMRVALLTCNKATFDSNEDGHNAETCSSGRDDVFIVLGINIVRMKTLAGAPGNRLGAIPEILESTVLYEGQKGVIVDSNFIVHYLFFLPGASHAQKYHYQEKGW